MQSKVLNSAHIEAAVKVLEDTSITYLMRSENYRNVEQAISGGIKLPTSQVKCLLDIFARDLKHDMRYAVSILKLLSTLLTKIKHGEYQVFPELLDISSAVVNILIMTGPLHKVQSLQATCLEVLLLYPDEAFIALGTIHQDEFFKVVDQYLMNPNIEAAIKKLMLVAVLKLLKILPPDKKTEVISNGFGIWFARLIPLMFHYTVTNDAATDIIEYIIPELTKMDYSNNVHWQAALKNICAPDKYCAQMITMLESRDNMWHRVWSCVVKLLGTHLHKSGGPINSLLLVLENAFKGDAINRYRAFKCWRVLIENFALNMNELFILKRIKLLSIPLKVNNAKNEDIAVAKFDVWWYLLGLLQEKIELHAKNILIPFLQFCFGAPSNTVIPGLVFPKVQQLGLQAFTEIMGHYQCESCVSEDFVKLPKPIISEQLLVEFKDEWLFAIKQSILSASTLMAEQPAYDKSTQNVTCIWKSFTRLTAKLVNKDHFDLISREMFKILESLIEEGQNKTVLVNVIMNILIPAFFEADVGYPVSSLNAATEKEASPIRFIAKLLMSPVFSSIYSQNTTLPTLKSIVEVGTACGPNEFVKWLLSQMCSRWLCWWCAVAEAVSTKKNLISTDVGKDLLVWPITAIETSSNAAFVFPFWQKLYNNIKAEIICSTSIDSYISNILLLHLDSVPAVQFLALYILPTIISASLQGKNGNTESIEKEICVLCEILAKENKLQNWDGVKESIYCLADVLTKFDEKSKVTLVEDILTCGDQTLTTFLSLTEHKSKEEVIERTVHYFLSALMKFLSKYHYLSSNLLIVDSVCQCATVESMPKLRKLARLLIMTLTEKNTNIPDLVLSKLKNTLNESLAIDSIPLAEFETTFINQTQEFSSPKTVHKHDNVKTPRRDKTSKSDNSAKKMIPSKCYTPESTTKSDNFTKRVISNKCSTPESTTKIDNSTKGIFTSKCKTPESMTKNDNSTKNLISSKCNTPESRPAKNTPKCKSKIDKKVLENSEEFVVIKSNWKFNPKKLTDHQKEVMARKREDNSIPALYQDLSMSLDDHIKPWQPPGYSSQSDTQDMSTKSNSVDKDTSKLDSILKNIPNSDILPNIMKTMIGNDRKVDSNSVNSDVNSEKAVVESLDNRKIEQSTCATMKKSTWPEAFMTNDDLKVQNSKSPRLSLKDKLNQNMKNLLNKLPDRENDYVETLNEPMTPTQARLSENNANYSAPSRICIERPTRIKRKPKKFDPDDPTLISKKRRNSLNSIDSLQSSDSAEDQHINDKAVEKAEEITVEETTTCEKSDLGSTNSNPTSPIKEHTEMDVDKNFDEVDKNLDELTTVVEPAVETSANSNIVEERKEQTDPTKEKVDSIQTPVKTDISDSNEKVTDLDINTSNSNDEKSTEKSKYRKKSRLANQLAIDTVEGHPLVNPKVKSRLKLQLSIDTVEGHPLQTLNESKRSRKMRTLNSSHNSTLNKSDMLDKSATEKPKGRTKRKKSPTDKKSNKSVNNTTALDMSKCNGDPEIQDDNPKKCEENIGETPRKDIIKTDISPSLVGFVRQVDNFPSQDFIESSQDSSASTIHLKTPRRSLNNKIKKKVPSPEEGVSKTLIKDCRIMLSNKTIEIKESEDIASTDGINGDEVETQIIENKEPQDTCMMDTEQMTLTLDGIVEHPSDVLEDDTQMIAEADTQPIILTQDCNEQPLAIDKDSCSELPDLLNDIGVPNNCVKPSQVNEVTEIVSNSEITSEVSNLEQNEQLNESVSDNCVDIEIAEDEATEVNVTGVLSSPFKDNEVRNKEFLNNTLDISPIKNLSPIHSVTPPGSPDSSDDSIVIEISPYRDTEPKKCPSPEMFGSEKASMENRDISPPRDQSVMTSTSPSSSLSLKKNRPQVRQNGRAMQMLGLCLQDKMVSILNNEKPDKPNEKEFRRSTPLTTPAKRNLRTMYNAGAEVENVEGCEGESREPFLKLTKSLPPPDASPSGPILKRKLAEIADESLLSPSSKRKRVSFHDPPVSTMVSIQKYIETTGIRSPQHNHTKNKELKLHKPIVAKCLAKKLENEYKLDAVLCTTSEIISKIIDNSEQLTNDSEMNSLSLDSEKPMEITIHNNLNSVDPIFPELVECKDPISNIASELSSPLWKDLLVKELKGKIETVGDLSRLTELEINRLCIRAPKIETTRKVLGSYKSRDKNLIAPEEDCSKEEQLANILKKFSNKEVVEEFENCERVPSFAQDYAKYSSWDSKMIVADSLTTNQIASLLTDKLRKEGEEDDLSNVVGGLVKQYPTQFCEALSQETIKKHLLESLSPRDLVQFCMAGLQKVSDNM